MKPLLPQLRTYTHETRTIQVGDAIEMEASAFNLMAGKISSRGVGRVVGQPRYALRKLNSRGDLLGMLALCIEAWYSEHGCLDPGDLVQWEADLARITGRAILPKPRGKITR